MAAEPCPGSGRSGWRETELVRCPVCDGYLLLKSIPAGTRAHVPTHYSRRKKAS